jgi:hypothetical protein
MNGINTRENLSIIPLRSYDFLIGMDWLEKHHVVLDFYRKVFMCLDEDENSRTTQGILGPVFFREISTLQLKGSFRKGCHIYAAHMEETMKDREPSLEYYPILKYFEDVFEESLGLPPKRDIDFSIDLIIGASPLSNNPYKMSRPELKEFQM